MGVLDVDLRWLEGYFVRMKVSESSQIPRTVIDAVDRCMRLHVCSWNGVVGVLDVDLRSLEGYLVRMKVGESSEIWGVGGVSAVDSTK